MATIAIVAVACHFAEKNTICSTTIARINRAHQIGNTPFWSLRGRPNVVYVTTGDVPYEPGSKLLCELMRDELVARGISPANVSMAIGGTGSFLEPELVTRDLKERYADLREIIVVSSPWQLWVGRPFWQRYAQTHGIAIRFGTVPHTGGIRTRLFYFGYGAVIRTALFIGLWPPLERFLARTVYEPRRKGFRVNGCA